MRLRCINSPKNKYHCAYFEGVEKGHKQTKPAMKSSIKPVETAKMMLLEFKTGKYQGLLRLLLASIDYSPWLSHRLGFETNAGQELDHPFQVEHDRSQECLDSKS